MDFAEEINEFDYFERTIKRRYSYLSDEDVVRIVNKAKMIYFSARFPSEPQVDEVTRPLTSFKARNWVLACCEELIERLGFNSATGYRENGVSWTFDNAEVSERLLRLVKPIIGVIS